MIWVLIAPGHCTVITVHAEHVLKGSLTGMGSNSISFGDCLPLVLNNAVLSIKRPLCRTSSQVASDALAPTLKTSYGWYLKAEGRT